jgi:8-oxo-dGTP pyrophosphatase MutT (NUDIX family)
MHSTFMEREFSPASLRRLRSSPQAAAICYRISKRGIEFLLVQTGGGRWTFPKGNAEPGLSHAQAAAMEAFEEAGVHGRIEEVAFAKYIGSKRVRTGETKSIRQKLTVSAHLCEVTRMEPAEEAGRNPSWFSCEQAKRRLRRGRPVDEAAELIHVVERAAHRIEFLNKSAGPLSRTDALQEVCFEAAALGGRLREAAFARYLRQDRLRALPDAIASEEEYSDRVSRGRTPLKQLPN